MKIINYISISLFIILITALNADDWIKFIKEIPEGSRITLTGGEPLVIKNFKEIFRYLK